MIYNSSQKEIVMCRILKKIRETKRLKGRDLEEINGMTKSNVSRFECNKHSPTMRSLKRYCDALNLEFEITFKEKEEV